MTRASSFGSSTLHEAPTKRSRLYVKQEDEGPQWINNTFVNNDYIESKEPLHDKEKEEWI